MRSKRFSILNILKLSWGALLALFILASFWMFTREWADTLCQPKVESMVSEARALGRCYASFRLAYVCENTNSFNSIERADLIALNWEICPQVVLPITLFSSVDTIDVVIADKCFSKSIKEWLVPLGFSSQFNFNALCVWTRENVVVNDKNKQEIICGELRCSESFCWRVRELGSTVIVLIFLILLWCMCRNKTPLSLSTYLMGFLLFALLSVYALHYTLLPPNGLGVYGGKAKLFLCRGGFPTNFYTSTEWLPYQPSYPIGMLLPAILAFVVNGQFGDQWLQIFVPTVLALLYLELVSEMRRDRVNFKIKLFALSAFFMVASPLTLRFSSGFYAEPLAGLFLVMGYRRVQAGKILSGWGVMGLASFFRIESILIIIGLWVVENVKENSYKSFGKFMASGILFSIPFDVWLIYCFIVGAHLGDFSFQYSVLGERLVLAFSEWIKIFLPWQVAGVISIDLIVLWILKSCDVKRNICLWLIKISAWLSVQFVGIIGLSFNQNAEFDFIFYLCIGRFVWLSLLPFWVDREVASGYCRGAVGQDGP